MSNSNRIACEALRKKITTAGDAAAMILPGTTLGMSGFPGSGYPKAVPQALAARIEAAHAAGDPFRVRIWTGASTGPELDGALAKADGIEFRLPYNSDYRPMLQDYFAGAMRGSYGLQTPSLPAEALGWHQRFIETGSMR